MNSISKISYIAASMALLSANGYAQEDMRHAPLRNATEKARHITIKRAPSNAAYQTSLVGFVYYASSWEDLDTTTPMGIYSIETEPGAQPQPFARIGTINSHCNGGAVLAGDTYWYIWRQTDPTGTSGIDISQLYSYNIKTGTFNSYGVVSSDLASNSDKSWDSTEDKIYGQYVVDDSRKLCIVDYETQTVTPVGNCNTYFGIAFDNTGQLWGIDSAGDLYKVNKRTGAGTKIGSTGIKPRYAQSMTFDLKTNDLYWASYADSAKDCSRLYKVDTSNAKATLITVFEDREEIMGLGVMPPLAPDNAPGYATNLTVKMDNAANTGTISFSLPEYTYMGNPIAGDVQYKVLANGNLLFDGKDTKGTAVTKNITLPTGDVTVAVVCSNNEGDGPSAIMQQWVGDDYPLAPANVHLTINETTGKFNLTWDAVTEGEHGGYINPSNISYKVVRQPDNKSITTTETSYEETVEEPNLPVDYYYEITATNGWRESSEPSQSNHVPYGKGFEVPYFNNFDDAKSLDLFYTIDGNGDSSTWRWSNYGSMTAYIFTGTDHPVAQNDWLITPGIDMKGGNRYEITYIIRTNLNDGRFSDKMETAFGIGVNPDNYIIAEKPFVCTGRQEEKHTVVITPETDGYYHFGFHAISDCIKGLSIQIDELNIDVLANEGAPAEVTNLSAKASQGTAPVNIKFTAPSKDNKGNKLTSLTKIDVFRNTSELVKSVPNPEPGKQLTVIDNKGARGMTKYTVVAYNEVGIGERADIEIFLGMDVPGRLEDIMLIDAGDGNLNLSWKGPKDGQHGGYCDPNNLTYNVYKLINGHYVDFKKGVQDKELIITATDYYSSEQSLDVYAVSAINSAGEGYAYQSSEVIVGMPYKYPFGESWVNGREYYDCWYRMNSAANGWLPVANYSSDNDNGCIEFDAAADGDMSYICLGKVSMATASRAKLIFDYYALPGSPMSITPEINLAFNGGWKAVQTLSFANLTGDYGWREAVVDLSEFTTLPYISVRFLGVGSTSHPLRIDNVRIMDSDKTPTLNAGIGQIPIDGLEEDAEYYDVNGLKVTNPSKGTVLIRRSSNGKTAKVVF